MPAATDYTGSVRGRQSLCAQFLNEESVMTADLYRKIEVSKNDVVNIATFKDSKILDEGALDELNVELVRLINDRAGIELLLDFHNVEFMSSAMLGLLGKIHRKVGGLKGKLKMCSIRPQIYEVFKLTNLNKLFSIHKDEAEALAAFAK
ncbi:MAG: STAS domain-containing protein [Planctomycetota bacterium]